LLDFFGRGRRARGDAVLRDPARALQSLINSAPLAIVALDRDRRVVAWSPYAERMFGWTAIEVIGRLIPIVPEDERNDFERVFAEQIKGSSYKGREVRRRCKDGRVIDVALWTAPVRDEAGAVVGTIGLFQDLSERRRSERAMQESERRLRAIMDYSPAVMYLKDPEGRYLIISRHFERLFGTPAGDAVGKTAHDIFPGERARQIEAYDQEVVRIRAPVVHEIDVTDADGASRTYYVVRFPVIDDEGRLVAIGGISTDVTDRKKAERERDELLARYQTILDHMALGCVLTDRDLRFVYWNAAAERIFGYTFKEVRGQHPFGIITPPASQAYVQDIFDRLIAGEKVVSGRGENITKDGRIIVGEWQNWRLEGQDGAFLGILSMCQDITERLETEKQLIQAQKMEAVGRLTGGVAHDFNNLLQVILGNAEMALQEAAGSVALTNELALIRKAAERASELIQRMLAFSRQQTLRPVNLDLRDLVSGMASLLRRTLGESIEIALALDKEPNHVEVDPAQLESALLNLAINARDAMPAGGRLMIATRNVVVGAPEAKADKGLLPGRYGLLIVTDTGTGMASDVLAKVFEPFFTTKEVGKGSGLGLSMVYGFVKQSNGYVKITSQVGVGTTVSIYLPSVLPAGVEDDATEKPTPGALPTGAETILVVEDDSLVRGYVARQLQNLGYRVIEAEHGPAALAELDTAAKIDLLFTDVVMPKGMSGFDLAAEVRRRRPGLKILFTSGYTEETIIPYGKLDAGTRLLAKPYRRADLARQVRAILDAR
jgi:PAS domain S-box-containing protein